MKLKDITTDSTNTGDAIPANDCGEPGVAATGVAAYPDLAELLTARTANGIINCRLLARDELELANLVLNRMDVDPHYVPSMVVLNAVRSINTKLAVCGAATP